MEIGALQELFGPPFNLIKIMAGPPFMTNESEQIYSRLFWCSTAYSIAELKRIEGVQ